MKIKFIVGFVVLLSIAHVSFAASTGIAEKKNTALPTSAPQQDKILLTTVVNSNAEMFKGALPKTEYTYGLMTGVGIAGYTAAPAVLVSGAKKILNRGFVPEDISNQVFIEAGLGPLFLSGGTGALFTAHLRWDFIRDAEWTFYGVGGFGGDVIQSSFHLLPRFAMGAFYSPYAWGNLSLRAEISHEFITAGVSFSFGN